MTLDQLRIFVTVAELQHVTRAAEQLGRTQSTVSSAIAALEARHDVTLFNRVGRGVELTAEGRVFLTHAKAVLAKAREAEQALEELSGLDRGEIAIFASQTIANYWLPPRLAAFAARHPAIALKLEIGNTAACAEAVKEGRADLGFIEGEIDEPELSASLVASDELALVVGNAHRWLRRVPDLPQGLTETRWALREAGSGTRSSFERALERMGFAADRLDVVLELPSNEALCAAVASGELATVVSVSVARPGVESGRLSIIPLHLGSRAFRLIRHRERQGSRAVQAFRQELGVSDKS